MSGTYGCRFLWAHICPDSCSMTNPCVVGFMLRQVFSRVGSILKEKAMSNLWCCNLRKWQAAHADMHRYTCSSSCHSCADCMLPSVYIAAAMYCFVMLDFGCFPLLKYTQCNTKTGPHPGPHAGPQTDGWPPTSSELYVPVLRGSNSMIKYLVKS